MYHIPGKTILHIDDNPEAQLIVRNILLGAGAVCLQSNSVDEGLVLTEQSCPHLILLDLSIPSKNGFYFLERRTKSPWMHSIPVIVLTGSCDRETVERAKLFRISDYLLKPFKSALLLQKIRKTLRSKEFQIFDLPEQKCFEVKIRLPAELKAINETELIIEAPILPAPNSKIRFQSSQLEGYKIEETVAQIGSEKWHIGSERQGIGGIRLLGLKMDVIRQFRVTKQKG